jgi:hypothetical protein
VGSHHVSHPLPQGIAGQLLAPLAQGSHFNSHAAPRSRLLAAAAAPRLYHHPAAAAMLAIRCSWLNPLLLCRILVLPAGACCVGCIASAKLLLTRRRACRRLLSAASRPGCASFGCQGWRRRRRIVIIKAAKVPLPPQLLPALFIRIGRWLGCCRCCWGALARTPRPAAAAGLASFRPGILRLCCCFWRRLHEGLPAWGLALLTSG